MKQYEKYKLSGIEWIGEIPSNWDSKRLKYVALVQPSNVDKKVIDGETTILLCNYMDVYKNEFIDDSINFMEATATESEITKFKIKQGDVLVTKDSETADDIANPALVKTDFENVICGYHLTQMRPNRDELIGEYLFRLFQGNRYKGQFEVGANGVTRFGLSVSSFSDAFVPLPTVEEQAAIANYLNEKTAQIDNLIANKQKLIELLKEERTAIINQAVTKGINHKAKLKPSGIEWLGDIPEHWQVKKLKYVLRINSGGGIKSDDINFEGSYPVYGGNGILGYAENYSSDKVDIIIGRVGAKCGNVRLVGGKKWISDNALVATVFDGSDLKYVAILLEAMNLNLLANQNAQPLITGTMVKEKLAVFPPTIEEQISITSYIETETQKIDTTIFKIEKEIELLQEYRTALISEVVTGKIKVI